MAQKLLNNMANSVSNGRDCGPVGSKTHSLAPAVKTPLSEGKGWPLT